MIDSGIGGLSVLLEVRRLLPEQAIIYLGDSAHCPYGTKSTSAIQDRCLTLCDYLVAQGATLIIVACNSATIAAVEMLRAEYPVPIIGMEPAVKPAARLSQSGVIGVLATEASLAGEKFHRLVSRHARGLRVIKTPCPRFVRLVESGTLTGPEAEGAIRAYTAPMLAAKADVLILGCTHYPFLLPLMRQLIPEPVKILETGSAVARRTLDLLEDPQPGPVTLLTSGSADLWTRILPLLCPHLRATVSSFTG